MKITFPLPTDHKTHRYCISCLSDGVHLKKVNGLIKWECPTCDTINDRYIHIGNMPQDGKWRIDDNNELLHESAGVFVRNPDGKYLFFERITYPLGYTIPAGHVDKGEEGLAAAARELEEEVGIIPRSLTHIASPEIVGDMCVGGADTHEWHLYRENLSQPLDIRVLEEEEGKHPVWMTLDEAKAKELPFAIRYILENFAEQIEPKRS